MTEMIYDKNNPVLINANNTCDYKSFSPSRGLVHKILDQVDMSRYWELRTSGCMEGDFYHFQIELLSPSIEYYTPILIYKGKTRDYKKKEVFFDKYYRWISSYFSHKGFEFAKPEILQSYWVVTTLDENGLKTKVDEEVALKKNNQLFINEYSRDQEDLDKLLKSEGQYSYWFQCRSFDKDLAIQITENAAKEKAKSLMKYFEKYLKNLPKNKLQTV